MIHIIILFICALVDVYLLLNTIEEVRVRKDEFVMWKDCPWKRGSRFKYPAYVWALVILTLLTIPTAIICPFLIIVVIIGQYNGVYGDNYSSNLSETRVSINLRILKFLNIRI